MDEVIVSVWSPNTCNPLQEQIKRNWPVHCSSWRDMCRQETCANHQLSCIVSVSHPGVKCCQTHPPVFPWTALSSNGGLGGLRPDQGEECEVRSLIIKHNWPKPSLAQLFKAGKLAGDHWCHQGQEKKRLSRGNSFQNWNMVKNRRERVS